MITKEMGFKRGREVGKRGEEIEMKRGGGVESRQPVGRLLVSIGKISNAALRSHKPDHLG